MKRKTGPILLAALLAPVSLVLGCAGSPVRSYEKEDANLQRGQTFRWLTQADALALGLGDPRLDYLASPVEVDRRPELEARLRPQIEKSMADNGYVPARGPDPDLYVTFYARAPSQGWVSSWSGTTPGVHDVPAVLAPGFDRDLLLDFREGDVYLVLYDRRSLGPVWTGIDSGLKQAETPSRSDVLASIERLVSKIPSSG